MADAASARSLGRRSEFYGGLIEELYAYADARFDQAFHPTVGGDLAQHIELLQRNGIEVDAALQPPDPPDRVFHIFMWFTELTAQRRQAMAGVHPLVWSDMLAWSQLTGERPSPQEWPVIMQLDQRFRAAAARAKEKEDQRNERRKARRAG